MRIRVFDTLEDQPIQAIPLTCRQVTHTRGHINGGGTAGAQSYGDRAALDEDELEVVRHAEAQPIDREVNQANRRRDERYGWAVGGQKVNLMVSRSTLSLDRGLLPVVDEAKLEPKWM